MFSLESFGRVAVVLTSAGPFLIRGKSVEHGVEFGFIASLVS